MVRGCCVVLPGGPRNAHKRARRSNQARQFVRAEMSGATPSFGRQHQLPPFSSRLHAAADIWVNSLRHTKLVAVMVSEENDEAIVDPELVDAKYAIAFDPLDGSSNIDVNVSIGSIWSIFRRRTGSPPSAADCLQPGTEMVCAGYVMYGSSTEMVLTFGEGVQMFSLDPSIGEVRLGCAVRERASHCAAHPRASKPSRPKAVQERASFHAPQPPERAREALHYAATRERGSHCTPQPPFRALLATPHPAHDASPYPPHPHPTPCVPTVFAHARQRAHPRFAPAHLLL